MIIDKNETHIFFFELHFSFSGINSVQAYTHRQENLIFPAVLHDILLVVRLNQYIQKKYLKFSAEPSCKQSNPLEKSTARTHKSIYGIKMAGVTKLSCEAV